LVLLRIVKVPGLSNLGGCFWANIKIGETIIRMSINTDFFIFHWIKKNYLK
jgi:hypothetical protein